MRSSVDFWYLLISRRATVPGLYLWGFLTPPVAGADFLAALVASCFLGALPPVDFLAVCLVRAIANVQMILIWAHDLPPFLWRPFLMPGNTARGLDFWRDREQWNTGRVDSTLRGKQGCPGVEIFFSCSPQSEIMSDNIDEPG